MLISNQTNIREKATKHGWRRSAAVTLLWLCVVNCASLSPGQTVSQQAGHNVSGSSNGALRFSDDSQSFSDDPQTSAFKSFSDSNTEVEAAPIEHRQPAYTPQPLPPSQSQSRGANAGTHNGPHARRGMLDQLRGEPLVDMQSRRVGDDSYGHSVPSQNRQPVSGANASMSVRNAEQAPPNPYRTAAVDTQRTSRSPAGPSRSSSDYGRGYGNSYGRTQLTSSATSRNSAVENASYNMATAPSDPGTADRNWLIEQHQRDQLSSPQTENSAPSGMSFIDREAQQGGESEDGTNAHVMRIAVNTVFVLSVAIGLILLAKQWFKIKQTGLVSKPQELAALKVIQVVPLSRTAALHLIEGSNHRFVVAMDSTGIKSVNVVHSSFSDEMLTEEDFETQLRLVEGGSSGAKHHEMVEADSPAATRAERNRQRGKESTSQSPEDRDNANGKPTRLKLHSEPETSIEPTPDMDERLIKMLLNSKKAG